MTYSTVTDTIVGMTPTLVAASAVDRLTRRPPPRTVAKKRKAKKRKQHRKHTPIVSRQQQKKFGAELSRREAGEPPQMPGITKRELEEHLEESRGKNLPEYSEGAKMKDATGRKITKRSVSGRIKLVGEQFKHALSSRKFPDGVYCFEGARFSRTSAGKVAADIKSLSGRDVRITEEDGKFLIWAKPQPQGKISLKPQGDIKLIKVHDDGDMTVKKGKQRFVVTTDKKVFKELPRQQAVKTGLTSIKRGKIYHTPVRGGTLMSRHKLSRIRRR
ncbi:MAG: hypothetical protein PHG35_01990 [Dehalococcoidales bacterium]|nr:hypothetical protein [Dehalococcoidales bacterium]